jgi:heat shock protein HtpX
MASALGKLKMMQDAPSQLPDNMTAFGIRGEGLLKLMSTHPPLDERIARLR